MGAFDGPQDRFTKRRYVAEAVLGKGTGPALVRISAFNNKGQGLGSSVMTFDVDQAWHLLELLGLAIAEAERNEDADPIGKVVRAEQEAGGRHVRRTGPLSRADLTVHPGGKG